MPVQQTLQSLRGEQWLHQHPEASPELAAQIKRQMMEAFYTDTDVWKQQILDQAREHLKRAPAPKGATRAKAVNAVDKAINEVKKGIEYDRKHQSAQEAAKK